MVLLRRSFNRSKFTFEATKSKSIHSLLFYNYVFIYLRFRYAPRSAYAPCIVSTLPENRDRLIKISYCLVYNPILFQIKTPMLNHSRLKSDIIFSASVNSLKKRNKSNTTVGSYYLISLLNRKSTTSSGAQEFCFFCDQKKKDS